MFVKTAISEIVEQGHLHVWGLQAWNTFKIVFVLTMQKRGLVILGLFHLGVGGRVTGGVAGVARGEVTLVVPVLFKKEFVGRLWA